MPKRILNGVVESAKCEKTLSVRVERRFRDPLYKKIIKRSAKYLVHYLTGEYEEGDKVKIMESKPISKRKKWIIVD